MTNGIYDVIIAAGGLLLGIVNVCQLVLSSRSKKLHMADIDQMYSEAYWAVTDTDRLRDALKKKEMEEASGCTHNLYCRAASIMIACKTRAQQIGKRDPILLDPARCDHEKPKA